MSCPTAKLPPGFRFHPTDEELVVHYLQKQAAGIPCPVPIIAEVDIYKFDPWELPEKANFGERELYFFTPRDRKYPNGVRPNRAAGSGYWKATGTDKTISTGKAKESVGVKKALVFYRGKPPRGVKTDWIMHEYRLTDPGNARKLRKPAKMMTESSMRLDDWVLCRIYEKASHGYQCSSDLQHHQQLRQDCSVDDYMANSSKPEAATAMPKTASLTDIFQSLDYDAMMRLLENPPAEYSYPSVMDTNDDAKVTMDLHNRTESSASMSCDGSIFFAGGEKMNNDTTHRFDGFQFDPVNQLLLDARMGFQ